MHQYSNSIRIPHLGAYLGVSPHARIVILVASLLVGLPLLAQQNITVSSNHFPINIPDDDADFPIESTIAVGADLQISDVNVMVDIKHQSIGDLEIDLYSPSGERVRLADEVCGDQDNYASTVFDDEAANGIGSTCPPGSGAFRPDKGLDEFDGQFSGGLWTLVVEDDEQGEVGQLIGWSLEISGDFVSGPLFSSASVVSSASYQGGAVAVGEMASIFGAALGPPVGVAAELDPDTGMLPTELAGVRVFFDDHPAPLFYVSSRQINAQVPFEVAAQSDVTVRVEYDETGTGSLQVPVLRAGPALFTLNGRGQGHAVALNPNGSVNDANNRVGPGEVISVYGTGFGAVEPSIESGALAPASPLSRVVEPVEAFINGEQAQVTFAGLAPNFVALYQIDIMVPADTPRGMVIPLQIQVGDRQLENLTWISVE
jgi:uncharacterized protein (TIGR03437 family)